MKSEADMIAETGTQIVEAALQLFTEDSVDLCQKRLKAADLAHAFVPTLGMAMVGLRMRGGQWREDLKAGISKKFKNPINVAGVHWAVDALQEKV